MAESKIETTVVEQLARLRADYLRALPAELAALNALAARLDGGENDRPYLEELYYRLHKLAGSGGTFGLATMSDEASILEQQLKNSLAGSLEEQSSVLRQTIRVQIAALNAHCPIT